MPFNDFFNRLFGNKEATVSCSSICRSGRYIAAYQNWVAAKNYLNWTGPYFKAYHFQKCKITSSPYRVQLINESNIQGALLFFDPNIGVQNFEFLFELLKDRVQQIGYNMHSSDTRLIRHERYHEKLERYVLTPPPSSLADTDLCDQLYGNVQIDYVSVNKHPGYIRIAANTYSDPFFTKPLPFMELFEKVMKPEEL